MVTQICSLNGDNMYAHRLEHGVHGATASPFTPRINVIIIIITTTTIAAYKIALESHSARSRRQFRKDRFVHASGVFLRVFELAHARHEASTSARSYVSRITNKKIKEANRGARMACWSGKIMPLNHANSTALHTYVGEHVQTFQGEMASKRRNGCSRQNMYALFTQTATTELQHAGLHVLVASFFCPSRCLTGSD